MSVQHIGCGRTRRKKRQTVLIEKNCVLIEARRQEDKEVSVK